MCLAVPGRIVSIDERDDTTMAVVDFGGALKDVCLVYLPDAAVGEWVIVHVGFAIQRLDEESARETLQLFESIGALDEEFGDPWGRAEREAAGLPSRALPAPVAERALPAPVAERALPAPVAERALPAAAAPGGAA